MPTDTRPVLTLGHSADADDVFMWWPITGKLDPDDQPPRPPLTPIAPHAPASSPGPADTPTPDHPPRLLQPPSIDTGPFRYQGLPGDIQAFNARAIRHADLDITALSVHAWAAARHRYTLTACGWSLGEGFGPVLVARPGGPADLPALLARSAAGPRDPVHAPHPRHPQHPPRIAVPGLQTTAFLTLSLMARALTARGQEPAFEPVPMPFGEIVDAVASARVDAGVLIHEAQIDAHRHGLAVVADLGAWWTASTALPLPLGGNALRRDLDARFGPGTLAAVSATLRRSIDYALTHRAESLAYARTFSRELSDADLDRYITRYVSPLTLDARPRGVAALQRLLDEAAAAGLCDWSGRVEVV